MFDGPFDRARREDSNTPGIAQFCRVVFEIAGVNGCELQVAWRIPEVLSRMLEVLLV